MFEWRKKINWKKVIVAAIAYTIIASVIRQVEVFVTLDYYTNPDYFGLWSKVMMPGKGAPPPGFVVYSLLFAFYGGVVLATLYDLIKSFLAKGFWQRVLSFTDVVVGLILVLFYMPVYLLFNIPFGLLVSWFISGVIIIFVSSIVFAKLLD
jgi:hypothetical protein